VQQNCDARMYMQQNCDVHMYKIIIKANLESNIDIKIMFKVNTKSIIICIMFSMFTFDL